MNPKSFRYYYFSLFVIAEVFPTKRDGLYLSKKDTFGGYKKNMNGIIIFFTKAWNN